MAPSTMYTRTSTALTPVSTSCLLRSLNTPNVKHSRVVSVRHLWWWSRHATWTSTNDENIDERMQRHQKIMRHRYSRALRRRAMWDRDDHATPWLWRAPDGRLDRRWAGCRTMSSTDPMKVRIDEKNENISSPEKFWAKTREDFGKFDENFESFKAAIDRAIEQDPYGTLFGRRLQSPPSANNSSWISWLFNKSDGLKPVDVEPTQPPGTKKIPIQVLDEQPTPASASQPKEANAPYPSSDTAIRSNAHDAQPANPPKYVYDPISGRKKQQALNASSDQAVSNKSLFEALFSEHGSGPDKPVKHHKVHGVKSETSTKPAVLSGNKSTFESSRKHEYQKMRASILGNSIDTTAEFGGKFSTEPVVEHEAPEPTIRRMPEPDEDVAPFSGTAYAAKADDFLQSPIRRNSSWLDKEGFRSSETSTAGTNQSTEASNQRLQPSLDRMQTGPEGEHARKFVSKLQPAVDRVQLSRSASGSAAIASHPPPAASLVRKINDTAVISRANDKLDIEKREDIDLLRASDVRAATKVTRTTKQEAADARIHIRNQLEDEFQKTQIQQPGEPVSDAKQLRANAGNLARSIDNVRKHAEKYPNGIMAKTMDSVGVFNDRFKLYEKPYSPGKVDLTARLDFSSDSLKNLPSIHKQPAHVSQTLASKEPNQEAKDYVKTRIEITESLKSARERESELRQLNDAQFEKLADEIRRVYEAEHEPIDLSLAQNSLSNFAAGQKQSQTESQTAGYLEKATDFFAEQAAFLTEVSQLSKDVKTIKGKAVEFESKVKNQLMSTSEASENIRDLTAKAETFAKQAEVLHEKFDKQSKQSETHPLRVATVKPGVPRYPAIERHTQVFEPRYIELLQDVKSVRRHLQEVQTNLHDMKRSKVSVDNVKHVPTTTSKPDTRLPEPQMERKAVAKTVTPSSPYLILVYNKSSGEVDQTSMDRLPWSPTEKVEKANAIRIMGNLNYPAAFVTHFVELEKAGYELSSGGGDMLIFSKTSAPQANAEAKRLGTVAPASDTLRNTIAAEEASSQPEISETIAQPKATLVPPQQAATVLDDIPVESPTPGPAAPTAPPTTPSRKPPRSSPKVRRQEQVFSGTIPLRSTAREQQSGKTRENNKDNANASENKTSSEDSSEPNLFSRTTRTIKRGVLSVTALGAALYTIGVVAEGIGAQAQAEGDTTIGPRTKVVMPVGQRPGIYSTESPRD